ncbi:TetR/AcrR family transcriptional regulator C-terminal domain-containing protein [Kitasatospora sp. NPDC058201]|uniref:TetR/AcrR family transcriptional regulator C-terminal domain-containing protein n=1 Tax=Streptomycetaceae TaxID=2062 RepID=UPI002E78C308|nr:TetR/AcrR family transcriptional regulator C-terminal domain-containing protein [Streptomyces sp. BE303]MED7955442.1 TetR/AcrR family transcriptional regulator C-terminal domain-containing protein [Streptomyces sp. BE303]
MASDRSSAGDPARTLALLWGVTAEERPGRRGPRQAKSPVEIAAAAIAIADAEGVDAVTMRRVSQDLGVSPMALYTYVPGKAELLDLMLDTVYAAMPRSVPADAGWRSRVTAVAEDNRALHRAHPWTVAVATSRPPLGPGLMAKYEYELGALAGTGLPDVELDAALTHLLGFVETCARMAADGRAARQESAMSDAQWWTANAALLARVFDAERYPVAARVGSAAGEAYGGAYNPDHAYAFGLARVLDGLAALIEERREG